jgi:hypothetical protein
LSNFWLKRRTEFTALSDKALKFLMHIISVWNRIFCHACNQKQVQNQTRAWARSSIKINQDQTKHLKNVFIETSSAIALSFNQLMSIIIIMIIYMYCYFECAIL